VLAFVNYHKVIVCKTLQTSVAPDINPQRIRQLNASQRRPRLIALVSRIREPSAAAEHLAVASNDGRCDDGFSCAGRSHDAGHAAPINPIDGGGLVGAQVH
jgi:hypothetical protein